ncbi:hypothetical protein H6G91_35240 [Nostoc muscorum FACHB-395]|nr:hypothetical protein [Desmonostoc muscorum FACHB-395]
METNEQENLQDPLFEEVSDSETSIIQDGSNGSTGVEGAASAHKAYTTTEDSNKYLASKESYTEPDSSGVEGAASAHKAYTTTEDSNKYLASKESYTEPDSSWVG